MSYLIQRGASLLTSACTRSLTLVPVRPTHRTPSLAVPLGAGARWPASLRSLPGAYVRCGSLTEPRDTSRAAREVQEARRRAPPRQPPAAVLTVPAVDSDFFEKGLAPLLGRPVLCITREIEWGTVIIG
jgi:hypothetical protein